MFIKSYNQFILEKQTDEPLLARVKAGLEKEIGECPRCGKSFHDCVCPEKDYFSTMNAYRTHPGKKHKSK